MTKIEELEQVMQKEADAGEALLQVMRRKQHSIVGVRGDELAAILAQEENLITPFRNLEEIRSRLASEIAGNLKDSDSSGGGARFVAIAEVLGRVPSGDAVRISTTAARLRAVVERILHINEQNRIFLQRSLRFVQDTLRLVTEDYTRQLVDHRM
jgi:flagellar biosynthesis/type III secretory pathway chaperone